jgi:hypothetical protein
MAFTWSGCQCARPAALVLHQVGDEAHHPWREYVMFELRVLCPLRNGLTYCAGIRRTSWPRSDQLAADVMDPVTTKEKIVVGDRVLADVELEAVPAD